MEIVLLKREERGKADHGWLNAAHSFSFGSYNNPSFLSFGLLRVFNDDIVAAGTGFGTHPHDNMEIVTIPLRGALEHRDSMGTSSVIKNGEVQIMSAGTGITHSEFNPSKTEAINLLQLWVFPKLRNIIPRYEQAMFPLEERKNKIQTVISPNKEENTLWINQDAWFSLGFFNTATTEKYNLKKQGNGAWVFVIEGSLEVEGTRLERRDSIGLSKTDSFTIKTNSNSEFLIIDVPMAY